MMVTTVQRSPVQFEPNILLSRLNNIWPSLLDALWSGCDRREGTDELSAQTNEDVVLRRAYLQSQQHRRRSDPLSVSLS